MRILHVSTHEPPLQSTQRSPVLSQSAGNSVTSTILLVLEVSIALISSCIPSIFNLLKHGAENFSRLSSKYTEGSKKTSSSSQKPGSGVNLDMGPVSLSIQRKRPNIGFEQLESKQKISQGSEVRLFGNDAKEGSEDISYGSNMV